jgi:single-strand DNA-binding protein
MANDINMVVIVGRLTRDAELRYTNSGTAVCRFSLAVNRRKRSGDSWEDEASFFDIALWGKQGEAINSYLEKGKQVAVHGELRQNRWEQDGQKRSRVEIVANNVQLLGSPAGGGGGQGSTRSQNGPSRGGQFNNGNSKSADGPSNYPGPEQFDDDIPF